MSLWNDTFRIEITITENPFQDIKRSMMETYTGSLKGAIRYVLQLKCKGNKTAVFYNSKNEFIKEIGF